MPITNNPSSEPGAADRQLRTPGRGTTPSSLVGSDPNDTGTSGEQGADDGGKKLMERFYNIKAELTDIAKSFPSSAKSINQALPHLDNALRQIVANPESPEPRTPRSMGL